MAETSEGEQQGRPATFDEKYGFMREMDVDANTTIDLIHLEPGKKEGDYRLLCASGLGRSRAVAVLDKFIDTDGDKKTTGFTMSIISYTDGKPSAILETKYDPDTGEFEDAVEIEVDDDGTLREPEEMEGFLKRSFKRSYAQVVTEVGADLFLKNNKPVQQDLAQSVKALAGLK